MGQLDTAISTILFSVLGNVFLFAVKYWAGSTGHSYALIADAMESMTDVIVSLLLLGAMLYASKKPTQSYPYGYGKAESLMTVISIFFIFLCGAAIFTQSLHNMLLEKQLPEPFTLKVLAIIILWKELCFQYVFYHAAKVQSSALMSEAWHHRSDAITSVAAFIGVAIAVFMGAGYEHADDWAALGASFVLFYNAYHLLPAAFHEILDGNVYYAVEKELRDIAQTVSGVLETEKCYIRKSGMSYHAELHIHVNAFLSVLEGHNIAHAVKRIALQKMPFLATLVIHIEPMPQK